MLGKKDCKIRRSEEGFLFHTFLLPFQKMTERRFTLNIKCASRKRSLPDRSLRMNLRSANKKVTAIFSLEFQSEARE